MRNGLSKELEGCLSLNTQREPFINLSASFYSLTDSHLHKSMTSTMSGVVNALYGRKSLEYFLKKILLDHLVSCGRQLHFPRAPWNTSAVAMVSPLWRFPGRITCPGMLQMSHPSTRSRPDLTVQTQLELCWYARGKRAYLGNIWQKYTIILELKYCHLCKTYSGTLFLFYMFTHSIWSVPDLSAWISWKIWTLRFQIPWGGHNFPRHLTDSAICEKSLIHLKAPSWTRAFALADLPLAQPWMEPASPKPHRKSRELCYPLWDFRPCWHSWWKGFAKLSTATEAWVSCSASLCLSLSWQREITRSENYLRIISLANQVRSDY